MSEHEFAQQIAEAVMSEIESSRMINKGRLEQAILNALVLRKAGMSPIKAAGRSAYGDLLWAPPGHENIAQGLLRAAKELQRPPSEMRPGDPYDNRTAVVGFPTVEDLDVLLGVNRVDLTARHGRARS